MQISYTQSDFKELKNFLSDGLKRSDYGSDLRIYITKVCKFITDLDFSPISIRDNLKFFKKNSLKVILNGSNFSYLSEKDCCGKGKYFKIYRDGYLFCLEINYKNIKRVLYELPIEEALLLERVPVIEFFINWRINIGK